MASFRDRLAQNKPQATNPLTPVVPVEVREEADALQEMADVVFKDPRPDIGDDSKYWPVFLSVVYPMDRQLCHELKTFRCIGAILEYDPEKKVWRMRPRIDPSGENGFKSQDEYNAAREVYLMPKIDLVKAVFARFGKVVGDGASCS